MISEKNLKLEIKRAKKAIKILKEENSNENYSYIQLINFLLLCRLEVELKVMENLLNEESKNA